MSTPWRDRALSLAQSVATASTTVATIARHDPWLPALATLHASTLALVLAARDNQALQLAVLGAGFAIVRGGGAINAALGDTWRAFASHDYFDPGGAFYAAAVAAPLLGIMCVQLILQLHTAWRLMVRVKTVQIKLARQAARKAD